MNNKKKVFLDSFCILLNSFQSEHLQEKAEREIPGAGNSFCILLNSFQSEHLQEKAKREIPGAGTYYKGALNSG